MKLEFPRQIIEQYSNITFHDTPSQLVPCRRAQRRTDRHDEANVCF